MTTHKSYRSTTRSTVRAACDRCHETKSRCARAIGSFECERCSRLGNVCAYSAPRPMGRPKEKSLTQSSSPPLKEYTHTHAHKAQREWKRQKRVTQRTCASVQIGNDNHSLASPPSSTSNVTSSILSIIPVEDSHHSISESWIPADWPSGEFDLDCIMQSDFTSPPNNSITSPGKALDHFGNTSFSAFPTPNSMNNPKSSLLDVSSNFINSNADLGDESPQEEPESPPESPPDNYEGCLHQLLRLHSDLYKITSHVSVSNSNSHLSEDKPSPESSPSSQGKAGMSSLDMILGTTQTLIDILQTSPSTSLPVPRAHEGYDSADRTTHGDSQSRSRPTNNNVKPSNNNLNHEPDIATALLSLSCYSSLLVAYDNLVSSLLSLPDISNNESVMQVPPSSPSLTFGTFSMTARSSLFVSTVLHVIKQMLEQLQETFQTRFSSPSIAHSDVASSPNGTVYYTGQNTENSRSFDTRSPVISAAHAAFAVISEKEKRFMEILATKR